METYDNFTSHYAQHDLASTLAIVHHWYAVVTSDKHYSLWM